MDYLIDTHVLIWTLEGDPRVSQNALAVLQNPDNDVSISIVSFWEIAIKLSIKKLQISQPLEVVIQKTEEVGINTLPLHTKYILQVENLPFYHRDPFDRLIIASAISEEIPIISVDKNYDNYQTQRIW